VLLFNWAPRSEGILGSGGIVPRILDLDTRWRCQLHNPAASPPGKSPWYPLNRRLDGSQSRSGRSGEEKNSHPLSELEPSIIQPVAQRYTTELSRLLGPTQHPTKWGPGALSQGIQWPGREDDHPPLSSAEVKNAWSYTSTPIRLHGLVLS
jgi:hypothetical protein